ncbi:MAG: ATP-dependent helicase [Planctomycetota bacterium]|jgi:DNA helicase-2/ATP-dependent DNA helicase PcrA
MSLSPGHLLDDLTEPQCEAATLIDGPVLVLAGPGSGKTTVVTRRVAYLIHQGIPPWQILALTFTNKAAGEMRERIDRLVPEDIRGRRGLTVATFHSFCARLMRVHGPALGLDSTWTIYDGGDQRDAIKRAIGRSGLSTENWAPGTVASAISQAKNRLMTADEFAATAGDFSSRSIARIYTAYERILKDNSALDFDDLLLLTARLFRDDATVRGELQERFQYMLIDEYQDTNHAQFVIADTLAQAHGNICVVGDPDQAIYGWRGADIRNILEFEERYPNARTVALGRNFRSTEHIVAAAAGVIACNRQRRPKPLTTDLGEGRLVTVMTTADEHHEARVIVEAMQKHHEEDDIPYREMAVLYRVNALSRVLEEAMRNARVPYVIARGTAFYERKEVRDALAYLRLVVNDRDEVALRRIVNDPPRGIGKTSLDRLDAWAMANGLPLLDALARAGEVQGLTARAANAMVRFAAMLRKWQAPHHEGGPATLGDLAERVVSEGGLEAHYKKPGQQDGEDRLANLAELISAAAQFEPVEPDEQDEELPGVESMTPVCARLLAFLESVALVSDADRVDPERGAVTLMTLHTAKGLEFGVVAMAGLENNLLPHSRAAHDVTELEEERRLCFVGMTRAKRHLYMSRAQVRTQRGLRERTVPSLFLEEIPAQHTEQSDLVGDVWEPSREWYDGPVATPGGTMGDGALVVGCRVRHPRFGLGRIDALTPRPTGSAARVMFDEAGLKTLIVEYAKLEVVE